MAYFGIKQPSPEEGKMEKKVHVNQAMEKFKNIMRWEVYPAIFICATGLIFWKYQTEFLNILPKNLFIPIDDK